MGKPLTSAANSEGARDIEKIKRKIENGKRKINGDLRAHYFSGLTRSVQMGNVNRARHSQFRALFARRRFEWKNHAIAQSHAS